MRGEIIKDDRDDNETGKLSQYLVTDSQTYLKAVLISTRTHYQLALPRECNEHLLRSSPFARHAQGTGMGVSAHTLHLDV
ncbi:hypothetical protein FOZG_04707 [Fusarium oxysporum Fo47]|uniref:Uncharacterized protein n=1 Tax=Fusarium oxysporum Fo47 TaxID=660027 RepID=W9KGT7_FUSOX|nr:hypothetical protein FOZG_04707 [Fusarium oxysporum Fo47]